MLGKRLVIGAEIHVHDPLPIAQNTVADIRLLAVGATMYLLIDIRGRDRAEIFILVRTKKLQHLEQSQTLDPIQ